MIAFNGMSTRLDLIYPERLRNRVHYTFLFTFSVLLVLEGHFILQMVHKTKNNFQTDLLKP